MKFHGGYNVLLEGRPSGEVRVLPEPDELHLPLRSERFSFTELKVDDGARVKPGQTVATDPANHSVPLLAPRAGTVRLDNEGHVSLVEVHKEPEEAYRPEEDMEHAPQDMDSSGKRRFKLLSLGAWQFLSDAHTGELPDPYGVPSAVIVSTLRLEPFVARGDVQIRKRLSSFTRGLEHLQSFLEYQPIYLVLPAEESELGHRVRELVRGYAWIQVVEIPFRYGLDNLSVLARELGLKKSEGVVWGMDAAGALAVDRALTLSLPSTVRIISVGGPEAHNRVHLKAMPGYPLASILDEFGPKGARVLLGGALTGRDLNEEGCLGLDAECSGLTILSEPCEREFLGFVRHGTDRRSYSKCFLSALRNEFRERLTTSLRGELRACVACGYCEEVCPARIMPHLIHKSLYQDEIEEAERLGVKLCVRCGLCSYVCPSKIELRSQFIEALEAIGAEMAALAGGAES